MYIRLFCTSSYTIFVTTFTTVHQTYLVPLASVSTSSARIYTSQERGPTSHIIVPVILDYNPTQAPLPDVVPLYLSCTY